MMLHRHFEAAARAEKEQNAPVTPKAAEKEPKAEAPKRTTRKTKK